MEFQFYDRFEREGSGSNPLADAVIGNAALNRPLRSPLPEFHEPYIDRYFLRTTEILKAEGLNPWVKAQVFIRKGPGEFRGIEEALSIIDKYSLLREHGGSVYALPEGSKYEAGDTVMVLEGPLQDLVEFETMYLGVITAETTKASDGRPDIDPDDVRENMARVVEAAEGRPVIYMGARHWRFDRDAVLSQAAFEGGATDCSTDIGAATVGKKSIGTIPHILENACAFVHGKDRAVLESTLAFDRVIPPEVPRIALVDYNNREIDDSLACAEALGKRLFGLRVDTCGENVMQGALTLSDINERTSLSALWQDIDLPDPESRNGRYWYGSGVTVTGVYALRRALDEAGFKDVKIVLSSGFGSTAKIKAFTDAEKQLGVRLFDILGVGGVFHARYATMDVVAAGQDSSNMQPLSKTGREYHPNFELEKMM